MTMLPPLYLPSRSPSGSPLLTLAQEALSEYSASLTVAPPSPPICRIRRSSLRTLQVDNKSSPRPLRQALGMQPRAIPASAVWKSPDEAVRGVRKLRYCPSIEQRTKKKVETKLSGTKVLSKICYLNTLVGVTRICCELRQLRGI
jgi:hypothetical protein